MIVHDSWWSNESARSTIIDYHEPFDQGLIEATVKCPGVGAFDHLEGTYDGAFEQLFGLGSKEFEQKFSKNSNARGVARWGCLSFDLTGTLLCNKKYRSPCPFKRKRAFISLSN